MQSCKNCRRSKTCRQFASIKTPGWCPQYQPTKKAQRHGEYVRVVYDRGA